MVVARVENHTGRELELMLAGVKPLVTFEEDADTDPEASLIPEADFDALVDRNVFVKGVRIFSLAFDPRKGGPYRSRCVLYALAAEAWRIPAMFLLMEVDLKIPRWDEGIDRINGALLGYADDQIESYVQARRARLE